jgi:hypothetical protein
MGVLFVALVCGYHLPAELVCSVSIDYESVYVKDKNNCCISDNGYTYVQKATILVQQDSKYNMKQS